jgi:hypothetical protein
MPESQIEADGQNLLTRRDVVTDRQIRLFRDRSVVEPGQFFFRCGSTVAAANAFLELIRMSPGANISNSCDEGRGGWSRGGTMSLKGCNVAVINGS